MAEVEQRPKKQQLDWEIERRQRVAVPTIAAGVLYLLSGITASSVLKGAPDVTIVQGLQGAVNNGIAKPVVSPRAGEVRFISHHAFGLIAGSLMAAIGIALLAFALTFLYDATRYRRPGILPAARLLLFYGGLTVAILNVASQVINAIDTHSFATGHDFTNHAVDQALVNGPARVAIAYLGLLAELGFAVGVVVVCLNAMRVGLLTRFMGVVGMVVAVLFVLPLGQSLPIISALWMVGLGVLFLGRWPNGDPPAWAAGEAVPWPPAGGQQRGEKSAAGRPAAAAAGAGGGDAPPEPAAPVGSGSGSSGSSRKRKRKRGPNQRNR